MQVRPLGSRVVVEPIKKDVTTLSGLILAHEQSFEPNQGKVVSAGPSSKIPVGSTVYYSRLAGQHLRTGQVVITDAEILAYE